MYTVKRAIILAAGKGNRMGTITDTVPKPLIPVNGVPMIETIIGGLHENGIYEIYIAVGYMKEAFQALTKKYPGVTLVENPYFEICSTLSSIYVCRDYLEEAIILEGDQYFFNSRPLVREFEHSEYGVFWTDEPTPEWVVEIDDDSLITKIHENGAEKGWLVYGLSRWTAEDAKKLRKYITLEFEVNKRYKIHWDEVAAFLHADEFKLYARETEPGNRVELDNPEELALVDDRYKEFVPFEEGGSIK